MTEYIDVFISSTSKDLLDYRRRLKDVVLSLGLHPIGMENFTPTERKPVQLCYDEVQQSEVFVGIYAYRYGFCPEKGTKYSAGECDGEKSITQMEYEWALQKGIPMYLFIVKEDASWPVNAIEDEPGKTRLKDFKALLQKEHTVGMFTSVEDLATQVTIALAKHQPVRTVGDWQVLKAPPLLKHFVGRQDDIEKIRAMLQSNGARVVIQGAGGMGKTTLAQHLGHLLAEDYPGGVLWAYMGPTATVNTLPFIWENWKQVTSAGRNISAQEVTPAQMKGWLEQAPGKILAILDDAWNKETLFKLLDALPDSAHVITTTRNADLIQMKTGKRYELHHLLPDDALQLLRGRVFGEADITDEQINHLRKITDLVENHALALHLVATYIEQNTIHDLPKLIERLQRHRGGKNPFKELQLGDDRDENLEVALFLSYNALDEAHQRAFRMLGVIPSGLDFSESMAMNMWGVNFEDDDAVETAEDRLKKLVQAGMVDRTDTGRYDLHLLFHNYAYALLLREQEQGRDELTPAREGYARAVIEIAGQFKQLPLESWREVIEPDYGHLHARGNALVQEIETWLASQNAPAMEAFAQPQPSTFPLPANEPLMRAAFAYMNAGVTVYVYNGYIGEEGQRWLEMGVMASRVLGDMGVESVLLSELGAWYNRRGRRQDALRYYDAWLLVAVALTDAVEAVLALNNTGNIYADLGEQANALKYYRQALAIAQTTDNKNGETTTLNNLARIFEDLDEKERAVEYYEQALALTRAVGDKTGEATTLAMIGGMYAALRDPDKALEYYGQSLSLSQAANDERWEVETLNGIGNMYASLRDTGKALEYYEKALALSTKVNYARGKATALNNIGNTLEKEKALPYYEQALPLFDEISDRLSQVTALRNIGSIYADLLNPEKALQHYQQALIISRAIKDPIGEALILNDIATVYADLKITEEALSYYRQVLPMLEVFSNRSQVATILNNVGRLYADLNQKEEAIYYYDRALPVFRQVGDRRSEAITLDAIGNAYADMGKQARALIYYRESLSLIQKIRDLELEATTLGNIASVYADLEERTRAQEFYNQALAVARVLKNLPRVAVFLSNIANIHAGLNQVDEALKCYEEVRSLYQTMGDLFSEGLTLNALGRLYESTPDKSLEYYEKGLAIFRQLGNLDSEAATLLDMARVNAAAGNKTTALDYYKQALPATQALKDEIVEATIYFKAAEILHYDLGRTKEAIAYMERCVELGEKNQSAYLQDDKKFLADLRLLIPAASAGLLPDG